MSYKDHIYSALARPTFQPLLDRFIGYALKLKGFNNYPAQGGELGNDGERWFIEKFVAPRAGVCLDVGANRGEFALSLLELTRSRVISVEPNPEMARIATERLAPFGARARVVEKALSSAPGTATLRVNPAQSETATLSTAVTDHAYPSPGEIAVETTTIDRLVAELELDRLDFIKVDVEGFELPCLEGARETIARLAPAFVQVEFHWHHIFTATTVFALAQRLPGYRAYRLLPRGLVPVDPRSTLDNIFAYSNLVFARAPLALR